MKLKNYVINTAAVTFGLIIASCSGNKQVRETSSVQPNNIRNYLVNAAQEISASSFTGIQSLDDWERIKPARYSEFIEMLSMHMAYNSDYFRCISFPEEI